MRSDSVRMTDHGGARRDVSVVIPVLNAAEHLPALLQALDEQVPAAPAEIILVDSGSTDRTCEIAAAHASVRMLRVETFSHGRARNVGVHAAGGDIVVLMSQDARPRDKEWLTNLVAPLGQGNVVAAFSRQIPDSTASPMEQFYLQKNFPAGSPVRRQKGVAPEPGWSDAFFSNVSAAVLRNTLRAHPFDEDLIMGEDQKFAKDVLAAGYATLYAPASVVIHSHRYSLWQTFKRYFDSVYALATIFSEQGLKRSTGIGIAYVREETTYLLRRAPLWLLYYPAYVLAKASATVLAHHADHLPRSLLRRISMHSYHWDD